MRVDITLRREQAQFLLDELLQLMEENHRNIQENDQYPEDAAEGEAWHKEALAVVERFEEAGVTDTSPYLRRWQ